MSNQTYNAFVTGQFEEIRKLKAINAELLEALKECERVGMLKSDTAMQFFSEWGVVASKARAAIDKAEGK